MRFTLGKAVWLFVIALVALMGGTFWVISTRASERVRELASRARTTAVDQAAVNVNAYLQQGDGALMKLAAEFEAGRCSSVAAAESCLLFTLAASPDLSEVTFTTAAAGAWQLSVFRAPDGRFCTQHIAFAQRESRTACRQPFELLAPAKPEGATVKLGDEDDPTDSYGYSTPFETPGVVLRSDFSRSKFDASLVRLLFLYGMPQGVLKVGLFERQLRDAVQRVRVNNDPNDPFRLFLCDAQGRLVTGIDADDKLIEYDDAFRIDPSREGPEIAAALQHAAALKSLAVGASEENFKVAGRDFHVAFRLLATEGEWAVGVVGPDDYYLAEVTAGLRSLLLSHVAQALLVLVAMLLMVNAVRRALVRLEAETGRMRRFDFTPVAPRSAFADVRDALWDLERAKTAMRALGRFVPIALVRRLFEANQEPNLGSEPRELTVMFSDIEGFTALVEGEDPGALARWLGDYFAAMTTAVHAEGGIVDKFIGDAVMALWNAPDTQEGHALRGCAAALRCLRETEQLYASSAWAGRPKLVTRFGVHTGTVRVGHFGAPDRVSYTAIGDGVNLASRLEGLNKVFGTRIIVSEAVEERARGVFAFRRLDCVAVKGKSQAVAVFELLGPIDAPSVPPDVCAAYERALAAYGERRFGDAAKLLEGQLHDPPSRKLHQRCLEYQAAPPPGDWDGTLAAEK